MITKQRKKTLANAKYNNPQIKLKTSDRQHYKNTLEHKYGSWAIVIMSACTQLESMDV